MNDTQTTTSHEVDLAALREKLASETGPRFWRSLNEASGDPAFKAALEREFPAGATVFTDPVGRRRFLQVMGASLALAGVTGCTRQPKEYIHPYAANPPEQTPGVPRYFSTAMPFQGYGEPLLVESHENRPTKIEGHPDHPLSQGPSSVFAQGSLLDMYDPDRLSQITQRGRVSGWRAFDTEFRRAVSLRRMVRGQGLRILTPPTSSPTMAALEERIAESYPEAVWVRWEPVNRDNVRAGAEQAFGETVETHYKLDQAKVLLSLDADFLSTAMPGSVRMTRDYAAGRKVADGDASNMNRLYVVEPNPTVTGSNADHRLRLKPSEVGNFAIALAAQLGVATGVAAPELPERAQAWVEPLAADLQAAGSAAVVIAGDQQPAFVHALAHAINAQLGAVGSTVVYSDPIALPPADQLSSLRTLVEDMNGGSVSALLILGGNPVYDAPADLDFAAALDKVELRAYAGLQDNETAELCHWRVPMAHYLESWSDIRAADGSAIVQQPLIDPLYGSRTDLELLSLLLPDGPMSDYDLVRSTWRAEWGLAGDEFEDQWRRVLHDGVVPDSAAAPRTVALVEGWSAGIEVAEPSETMEVAIRPDPTIWDGRYNNNGWLQELPKPISKVTWENYVQISPATAERMSLRSGDVVDMTVGGRKSRGPIWITPGQADNVATMTLGYGRRRTGQVGAGAGFDVYALRASDALWSVVGVDLAKRRERVELASVQDHGSMEGRHLVQIANASDYEEHPNFAQEAGHGAGGEHGESESKDSSVPFVGELPGDDDRKRQGASLFKPGRSQGNSIADAENPLSLYPEYNYTGYAWGMAIDLNACVGCNACTIACQSENNISVVGKDQVAKGREMHWIRIDRYFEGSLDEPSTVSQPVPCMQCENAPCEPVCPVGATVHSSEGLNDMVYNRCVGTRYCSNNCPYKVRRFNFLFYADYETESLKPMRNPDVTVRHRGVMEKCTYCVQRINEKRIIRERAGERIQDGDVVTACQQVCPAEAITFGDINDSSSKVSQAKQDPRNYGLLVELNTQPRTTYLARIRNPNPAMPAVPGSGGEGHGEEAHS